MCLFGSRIDQKLLLLQNLVVNEFSYLPFGLKSAPASFMRFIHEVLNSQAPELRENTKVYLDDILILTFRRWKKSANVLVLLILVSICQNVYLANLPVTIWVSKLPAKDTVPQTKKWKQFVITPYRKQSAVDAILWHDEFLSQIDSKVQFTVETVLRYYAWIPIKIQELS